ncbi:MAG: sugar phosphate nucleotidyltransferase [bacterium]|nr:sugar phosphate nucleotidyltransferase [bacterium]
MHAVIMAGGSGTRLWPMSRTNFPKQLHQLMSDKSLIQETFERLKSFLPVENIYISTAEKYLTETRRHLPELPEENYIIEPIARNTGPSLAYIAAFFAAKDPKSIVGTFASDHSIAKIEEFKKAIITAEKAIEYYPDHIVTIGLNPTSPDTGLGYIKMHNLKKTIDGTKIFSVEKFVEKPDLPTAKKYVSSWEYLWNASYFIWQADTLLDLFDKYAPEFRDPINNIQLALKKGNLKQIIAKEYDKMPAKPFDTVIMEKVKKVLVIPADLGWSDIGSWASLHDILATNTGSNIITKGNHIGIDNKNCLIYAKDKLIATVGLDDVIVVDTDDVILICKKEHAHDIKKLIDKLKEEGKHLYL